MVDVDSSNVPLPYRIRSALVGFVLVVVHIVCMGLLACATLGVCYASIKGSLLLFALSVVLMGVSVFGMLHSGMRE